MGMSIQSVLRFSPPDMPKAGGTVTAIFEARSTGARTAEKATYSVPAPQPYVFANASGSDSRVVQGSREEVTVNPADHRQVLVLQRIDSPDQSVMVLVNADVFEVDAAGNPVLDGGGQPLPPHPSSGFIVIQ